MCLNTEFRTWNNAFVTLNAHSSHQPNEATNKQITQNYIHEIPIHWIVSNEYFRTVNEPITHLLCSRCRWCRVHGMIFLYSTEGCLPLWAHWMPIETSPKWPWLVTSHSIRYKICIDYCSIHFIFRQLRQLKWFIVLPFTCTHWAVKIERNVKKFQSAKLIENVMATSGFMDCLAFSRTAWKW